MQRELNELEFLQYTIGQPNNIAMVVTLRGKLTAKILREAFKKLQARHPLLSVNVINNDQGVPWFYTNEHAEIPLTVVPPEDSDLPIRLLEKELSTPFEMSGPLPLARVNLITTPNPQLLLCMQHVICDGLSYAFLIRDLLSLLAQPDLDLPPLSVTEHLTQALPMKIARKIPKTARRFHTLFFLVKIIHRIKRRKSTKNAQMAPPNQDRSYKIHSWTLSIAQTSKLLVRCKQEQVSVNSALCTAFLSFNPVINNPVNLRNRLSEPVGEALGLFVGAATIKMKYDPTRSFWENARQYHHELQKQLRDKKVFWGYKIMSKAVPIPEIQRFGSLFIDMATNQHPFAITNLGDLDRLGIPSEAGDYQLESVVGGVSGPFIDAVNISIYTLRKELHFHINYYAYMADQWDFPKIASTAMDILTQALN